MLYRFTIKIFGLFLAVSSIVAVVSIYYLFNASLLESAEPYYLNQNGLVDIAAVAGPVSEYAMSNNNGFFVRDWSLWLGWNNVRLLYQISSFR